MGCPDIYYKRVMKAFLSIFDNAESSDDEYILESEILKYRTLLSEKEFYYNVGRVCEYTLNDAIENDGCDGMNACIGGLIEFEILVGLKGEGEYD